MPVANVLAKESATICGIRTVGPECMRGVAQSSFERLNENITDENIKKQMKDMGLSNYTIFFKTVSDTFQAKTPNQIDFEGIHEIIIKSLNINHSEANYDFFNPLHWINFDDPDNIKLASRAYDGGYRKSRKSKKSRNTRKARKSKKSRKSRKNRN